MDNQTEQTVFVSGSSIGFQSLVVPPRTFGQWDFVEEGALLYVLDGGCEVLGSATVGEESLSVVITAELTVTTGPVPDEEQVVLDEVVEWPAGCEPKASPSS